MSSVSTRATTSLAELVTLRRELHADPEVGLALPRTQRRVLDALDGLDLEVTVGREIGSVVAVLRGGRPGPVVLLRGDMDALPIEEATGLPFASINGAMHACGHDLHTAALVGAARILVDERAELPGTVLFMFQPGEEGYDGAGKMIAEGALELAGESPVAAYGVHVAADMPRGVVATRPGALMAAYGILDVVVVGRGGHGARPHEARDPITTGAEIVTALQTYVSRSYDVFDPVVVTVGEFHAGSAPNVVPGAAHLRAGVRWFSACHGARVLSELPAVARGVARAHGLDAEARLEEVLPPTINDADDAALYADVATALFGSGRCRELAHPRAGSEDFSRVLGEVGGAYGFLGAAPAESVEGERSPNHSPTAVFDDSILHDQAQLLAALARRRLGGSARHRPTPSGGSSAGTPATSDGGTSRR